jgi:hypothetical protein
MRRRARGSIPARRRAEVSLKVSLKLDGTRW